MRPLGSITRMSTWRKRIGTVDLAWQSRRRRGSNARYRPHVEALEDRTLLSFAVGPSVDIGPLLGNQNEASLAINPINANNLVAFSNDLAVSSGIRVYRSIDAGASWTNRLIANGDGLGVAACCDTQAAFDQFGNLFATYIDFSTPSAIKLLLSTDGGATFSLIGIIAGAGREDQPSVATGAGAVWVSYHDSFGSISARGAPVAGLGNIGAFAAPQIAPGSRGGNFGNVSIGPSGQVLVTYEKPINNAGPASIYINLDADGLGPGGFGAAVKATDTNVGGFDPIPAQAQGTVDAEANLAYDRSGGAHNGRVYLVYTDAAAAGSSDLNIFVRFSDNDGSSWSLPVRANDDSTATSQFLPQIAVDQNSGNVAVAWYDARNAGPANNIAQIIATGSADGGATFFPNVPVSSGISRSSAAGASNDFGDYMTMDYLNGVFYPVWSDNSPALNGNPDLPHLDIATARVVFTPPTPQQSAFVTQMYRDLLHRDPDPPGLTYFSGLVSNGVSRIQLASMIENTNESRGRGGASYLFDVPAPGGRRDRPELFRRLPGDRRH